MMPIQYSLCLMAPRLRRRTLVLYVEAAQRGDDVVIRLTTPCWAVAFWAFQINIQAAIGQLLERWRW